MRPRGRPKAKPDSVQRQEILSTARDLFVTYGYAKTTMDDLAAQCGISKRTLYRLYESKCELFAAIIDTHRAQIFSLPTARNWHSASEALEHMFRIDLTAQEEAETENLLKIVTRESDRCPELREIVRRHGAEVSLAELAGWLTARRNSGELSLDDPQACAQILMDMVFGTLVKDMPDHHPAVPRGQARAAHIRRCIAIFLNGVTVNETR